MSTSNAQTMRIAIKRHADTVIKKQIVNGLIAVARQMVQAIDNGFVMPTGSTQFPVDTANLHDATGVGVYSDGMCMHYAPTKRATKAQHGPGSKLIIGADLLNAALGAETAHCSKGIWLVLFSTVPYAYYINASGSKIGRGANFFESLKQTLMNDVIANLKPITT